MKYKKNLLRKKAFFQRKKKYLFVKKFNFNLIFNLIRKCFGNRKIFIAGYYPANNEVNVLKFLEKATKKNYKIGLPVIKSSNDMSFKKWNFRDPLEINKFGILEPSKSNHEIVPDLVMVPLLAFDSHLNRIGYGKGYYDKSLKKINKIKKKAIFLGIAYSFQKCKAVPTNKHDFKLDYIFTERGIISSN